MNVDTGQFAALRDEVAELEARLIEISRATAYGICVGKLIVDPGYRRARDSILGPQPRHLHAVDGGAP